jgi:bile acid:Na+ symporter, BASS family
MSTLIPLAIRLSIVLTVFALGLRGTMDDAANLLRRPGRLLRSMLAMNGVMPLVGAALAAEFALLPAVKIALVALAVSPVPPLLPRTQLKAGGQASYAIGLLVVAALLSVVFVPAAMALLGWAFGVPAHVPPATVAGLVVVTVLAPLALGLLVRRAAPAFAERVADPISRVAAVLLVVAVLPVLIVSAPAIYALIGNGTLAALVAFEVIGIATGHALGGPARSERVVLALATAGRHPGVAVAIATAAFPTQRLVVPAVGLYLIVSALVSALYLAWLRRRQAAEAGRAESAPSKRSAA